MNSIPPIVPQVLRTPGDSLDPGFLRAMEGHFGHDLGAIRIHADSTAAASTRAVHAVAYTVGSHLVFDSGRYAPATRASALRAAVRPGRSHAKAAKELCASLDEARGELAEKETELAALRTQAEELQVLMRRRR